MKRLDRKTRRTLTLAAWTLVLAAVVLMLPARLTSPLRVAFMEASAPLEQVTYEAGGRAVAAAGTLREAILRAERERIEAGRIRELENENAQLREELVAAARRIVSVEALSVAGFPHRTISAPLVAYDAGATRHSIVVGAGSTDGVARGQAVSALGAVVGTVTEVGPWRSRVRLLTDPAARLPCRLSSTRELCLLVGDGSGSLEVRWLGRDSEVAAGDVLVTAPVDDVLGERPVIPAGLPVATIEQVRGGGADPKFLRVRAAPRVNVQRLEAAEVIVPTLPEVGPGGG